MRGEIQRNFNLIFFSPITKDPHRLVDNNPHLYDLMLVVLKSDQVLQSKK
jgi:hypothetical protein